MDPHLKPFQDWFLKHKDHILREYFKFLSFPSISTDDAYKIQTRQTAEWLCAFLRSHKLENVELWETSRHPVVFASHLKGGKNRPTLLIYHHYDVQPVDPLDHWHSDPFKPEMREGQIYARGALDNKGQCFYSLNAIAAFLELAKNSEINLKIFIEGEEESRGEGTFGLIPKKKKSLSADYLLIVDTRIPSLDIPAITLGVRGIASLEIECINAFEDLHSGNHGGIAMNPNRLLATALAKLWDEKGRIAVPGFYDAVRPISKQEIASIDLSFDPEEYTKLFGVKVFAPEPGFSLIESNWLRPTLEINGMSGGYTGKGFKTIIPAKAEAKISCRLVPDQDPRDIAERVGNFLRNQMPKELEFRLHIHPGEATAYRTPFPSKIVSIAKEAFEDVFQKPCKYILNGASIPIVGALARSSGAEALMIGLGLPLDQVHAPNEHFGWDRFELGFLIMSKILMEFGK
jgi:acetylornithine deacetylase/succinyl-diaminopimelate desuccinylase-like protein